MNHYNYMLIQPTVISKEDRRASWIKEAKLHLSYAKHFRLEGSPFYYEILHAVAGMRQQALALL